MHAKKIGGRKALRFFLSFFHQVLNKMARCPCGPFAKTMPCCPRSCCVAFHWEVHVLSYHAVTSATACADASRGLVCVVWTVKALEFPSLFGDIKSRQIVYGFWISWIFVICAKFPQKSRNQMNSARAFARKRPPALMGELPLEEPELSCVSGTSSFLGPIPPHGLK